MSITTIKLQRSDQAQSWGFRIHGGADFNHPLLILKVTAGSLSSQQGLVPGDQIITINGQDAIRLRHREAQQTIMSAGNQVTFEVIRGDSANLERVMNSESNISFQSLKQRSETTTTTSSTNALASIIQSSSAVSTAPVSQGWRGPKYTEENIAEHLHSQASVLQTGAIGVNFIKHNDKELDMDKSEVLKMLKEMELTKGQNIAPPLSPSAVGLINRAYDVANQAQQAQAAWAQQLSPGIRTASPAAPPVQ